MRSNTYWGSDLARCFSSPSIERPSAIAPLSSPPVLPRFPEPVIGRVNGIVSSWSLTLMNQESPVSRATIVISSESATHSTVMLSILRLQTSSQLHEPGQWSMNVSHTMGSNACLQIPAHVDAIAIRAVSIEGLPMGSGNTKTVWPFVARVYASYSPGDRTTTSVKEMPISSNAVLVLALLLRLAPDSSRALNPGSLHAWTITAARASLG